MAPARATLCTRQRWLCDLRRHWPELVYIFNMLEGPQHRCDNRSTRYGLIICSDSTRQDAGDNWRGATAAELARRGTIKMKYHVLAVRTGNDG